MKILLTGANGFLGVRIRAALDCVAAPSLRNAGEDDVRRLIDKTEPDAVIHTAAISDIGACDADPDAAYHANVLLPIYLARAAQSAKLALFSSDQVYGGCGGPGPYREEEAEPVNLYARQKLEMERRVLDINPDAVLLRAAWMYDMPVYGRANRGNFFVNLLRAAAERKPFACPKTQMRSVTYAREAAALTARALEMPGGVYNFGSETNLSMYDTTRALAEALGLDLSLAEAPSRHNLWMDCARLREQGFAFRDVQDALLACARDYGLLPAGKA